MWETVHTEVRDGFAVALSIAPEDKAPDWEGETQADREETARRIDNGSLLWFVARVTASRHGIVLGTDYLGGCLYDSVGEFLRDEYFQNMVEEAIGDARRMIERLEQEEVAS